MENHTFKPGKKGRNQYVGSWSEPVSMHIDLPLTIASLRLVLEWGIKAESGGVFCQDIAHWCGRFQTAMRHIEKDEALSIAADIADDVDVQWDLYLANTYSFD